MSEIKDAMTREPYEAPVVEDLPLHTNEQVLATCKIGSVGGPQTLGCFRVTGGPCNNTSPS